MNTSTIISIVVVVVVLLLMLQINSLNSLFFLAVALSWSVKRQPGSAHSTRLDLESVADGVGPELCCSFAAVRPAPRTCLPQSLSRPIENVLSQNAPGTLGCLSQSSIFLFLFLFLFVYKVMNPLLPSPLALLFPPPLPSPHWHATCFLFALCSATVERGRKGFCGLR